MLIVSKPRVEELSSRESRRTSICRLAVTISRPGEMYGINLAGALSEESAWWMGSAGEVFRGGPLVEVVILSASV